LNTRAWHVALVAALMLGGAQAKEPRARIALTFDDLPRNGSLSAGDSEIDIVITTTRVLKKYRIPPSFGFINARQLENNPGGAYALQLWARAGNPLGNHTYSHLDLTKISVEDFQREIRLNEPALELLMPPKAPSEWKWFRYPYLHEGDTVEKRRAVREFLFDRGYRIAQTTIDWEDYLWNSAHARCLDKRDTQAIEWLRSSYVSEAERWIRVQRGFAKQVWGREINHVALLHLGSFSSTILPDLFKLLDREGFEIVTLEEAQRDPIYRDDPDIGVPGGGTLTEHMMQARKISWPEGVADKPREKLRTICQ
jgi:peptidoglycan/xylan/chitin deacetylase (PgdA/CDA1 family)